jgi:hypothetical protein
VVPAQREHGGAGSPRRRPTRHRTHGGDQTATDVAMVVGPGRCPGPGESPRGLTRTGLRGDPVRETIARVLLGAGPTRRQGPDGATLGYPLHVVEPLVRPAPYPKATPPHQSRGVQRLPRTEYEGAPKATYGSETWRPARISAGFVPTNHRRTRVVQIDEAEWLRWEVDVPWPTIDRYGRVRFRRWLSLEEAVEAGGLSAEPRAEEPELVRWSRAEFDQTTVRSSDSRFSRDRPLRTTMSGSSPHLENTRSTSHWTQSPCP